MFIEEMPHMSNLEFNVYEGSGQSLIIKSGDHPTEIIVQLLRIFVDIVMPIMPLGLVHILLQIAQRLIELQVARRLVEGAVHAFVELLLLHVGHFLYVRQLQSKQYDEAQAHDNGDDPNGFLLHKGKDKDFLNALTSFC